jgi:hypothetical protein
MTFDNRARRAVQGIHRAVEEIEMSSTKTPQRITRFDQYREGKSRNKRIAALVVGIAVPLVLLIVAVGVLRSDRDQNVPLTTPSTSVTPTTVSGSSDQFKAPFTYTLPQDWTLSGEGARYFSLDAPGAKVIVLRGVVAGASDCSDRPKQGVGTSSDAMTSWLSADPQLIATTPQPVRLGAATGSYVDVQLSADGNRTCPGGLVLVTGKPDHPQGWDLGGSNRKERVYVLDLPAGGTVTIVVTAFVASDFQHVIDQATPLVESFDFHK